MKIKLTKTQKRLRKECTYLQPRVRKMFAVFLQIGNQGFRLDLEYPKAEAEWMRDMLAKALSKVPAIARGKRK